MRAATGQLYDGEQRRGKQSSWRGAWRQGCLVSAIPGALEGGLGRGATRGQLGGQRRRTDATRRHGAGEERGRR